MAYWSVAILLVSISFFAYRHPPANLEPLTRWLRPGKRRIDSLDQDKTQDGSRAKATSTLLAPEEDTPNHLTIDVTEPDDSDDTPKVVATKPEPPVPALSLNGSAPETSKQSTPSKPPVPLFPASNSAQRTSSALSSSGASLKPAVNGSAGLMAPPARPKPAAGLSASTPASLRVPTTGPLPNRGPPANSAQRVSGGGGGLTVNGATAPPKARGKVLLAPGHSPMDWAALTRSSILSGVSTLQRVTPSMLKSMTGRKGKPAWTSWQGKVYNISPYLPFHPGGEPELMKAAGRDGTQLFMEVHPWVNWENMLSSCMVGVMVSENDGMANGGSSLDDMD